MLAKEYKKNNIATIAITQKNAVGKKKKKQKKETAFKMIEGS